MEVKDLEYGNCNTVSKTFEVTNGYSKYRVRFEYEEDYLDNLSISVVEGDSMFVFDPTNEDHLELAHHIYLKVCEARKELEALKAQSSKVSGKRK